MHLRVPAIAGAAKDRFQDSPAWGGFRGLHPRAQSRTDGAEQGMAVGIVELVGQVPMEIGGEILAGEEFGRANPMPSQGVTPMSS